MKLGFVFDSLGGMPFETMLDHAARLGVSGVEINTGGWSTAPHFDLQNLKSSASARSAFVNAFESRGLEIIALNANGNPLHPTHRWRSRHQDSVHDVRTPGGPQWRPDAQLGRLVLAAGNSGNPPLSVEQKLLPFWTDVVSLAKDSGVERIALELHGNQCVYNVPSLLKLRDMVGSIIGANLDPSHLFWMGADPLVAAEALGDAIYHVHAKDTMLNLPVQARTSLLENGSLMNVQARSWS